MKKNLLIVFLFFPVVLHAQNFEDGFSDGDFTSNPTWAGADNNFVIFNLDGNNVLRLNDDEASNSYLSTSSTNITGEWEFFVQIDGAAPSNSNKAEIFLMADIAELFGTVNGYAIRVGKTGDDTFDLVRFDNGTQTTILSDATIFQAGGGYRIKVSRDAFGLWGMEVGEGYNGELKNAGINVTDNTHTSSNFFGVLVTYTSSRVDDYYFDFKIDPPVLIIDPFFVDSFLKFSDMEIDISFNRDIDFGTVSETDFVLNGSINPQSFTDQGANALRITFADAFSGGENNLLISGIQPATNDTLLADTTFTFFVFDELEQGEVIINEFLKDPPTGSGLSEYIELKNTSSKYLNLKDWEIGDSSTLVSISDVDLVLLPNGFLAVTSNPDALTTTFGEGNYLDVSLPALNNTTDQIRLYNETGVRIDSLEYTPEWGGVDVALERRADILASTLQANWGDSPSPEFGTPGRVNQIQPDTAPPNLESLSTLNDSTLQLVFTEGLRSDSASNPRNYGLTHPLSASPGVFLPIRVIVQSSNSVTLVFDISFFELNTLWIRNQTDIFWEHQSGDCFRI